jgi:hypothetical protein
MRKLVLDGVHLRRERDRAGVTEKQIAQLMGASLADVSRAFNGHPMVPDFIWRLSMALGELARRRGAER